MAEEKEKAFDPKEPFKLSAPLSTHKGEVMEIHLKMPKARSFMKHGSPYKYVNGFSVFDIPVMIKFAADMSGIDEILLNELEGSDVIPLCLRISDFLQYNPRNG